MRRCVEAFANRTLGWMFGRDRGASRKLAGTETVRVVYAYAALLSMPRAAVCDEAALPYPKSRIKEALVAAIGLATQATMRGELRMAFLALSEWQNLERDPRADSSELASRVAAERRLLDAELIDRGL